MTKTGWWFRSFGSTPSRSQAPPGNEMAIGGFGYSDFEFVSDFEIRISDLI
jgi:hypothetical protein